MTKQDCPLEPPYKVKRTYSQLLHGGYPQLDELQEARFLAYVNGDLATAQMYDISLQNRGDAGGAPIAQELREDSENRSRVQALLDHEIKEWAQNLKPLDFKFPWETE